MKKDKNKETGKETSKETGKEIDWIVANDETKIEIEPSKGLLLACCDCGLVHLVDLEVKVDPSAIMEPTVIMTFHRDNVLTEAERKTNGIPIIDRKN